MKAFVLINARAGKNREVVSKLGKIQGVSRADACWGRPDIFAIVDAENGKSLADTVLDKILAVDGVESTDTHIVIE
jgi:DNA-binding Lrp family transcriptional regulator